VLAASAAAVQASSLAAASSHPELSLNPASGGTGTRVVVIGRDCPKPVGQRDTLAWHDHYDFQHDRARRPPLGVWRSVPLRRLSPTTVRAVFVVRPSDHRGRGLLDLFCSGDGNATATFEVTG